MTTPTPTPQAAPAPVASTQPVVPEVQHVNEFPTDTNWRSAFLDAEPTQTPQPVVSPDPEPVVEQTTAETQPEVVAAPPAVEEVNTETLNESDVAIYQRIMDDLVAQHPGVDEKFLKRTADTQFQVVKLREKVGDQSKDISKLLNNVKKSYKPTALTQLEQSLAAPPPVAPVAETPVTPVAPAPIPQQPGVDPIIALANSWKRPSDPIKAETAAWAQYHDATTIEEQEAATEKIWAINEAKARLQMYPVSQYIDGLKSEVQQLRAQLAEIAPTVKQSAAQEAERADNEFAIAQLEAAGATGIRDLFKVGKDTLEYNGQTFPDTPYNRIVAEHPEILDLVVSHPDPRKANQLTQVKRMKLALALAGVQQEPTVATSAAAPNPAAQALMEASAQVQPVPGQSTRQAINAGPGASGSAPPPGSNFFESGASAEIRRSDWYSR